MMDQSWWVYMVQTEKGKLYTGISTDVDRRFLEHSTEGHPKAAKFFRVDRAKKVVYREACNNRSEASRREAAIKKMARSDKLGLLGGC